ncbi:uncharacterized protein LOC143062837 isoform X1 [Mytilus galloprovincialis]|uniref:uncharacterized protein LOC143062837 isoform X1 n=1 Tax=Mytilus galloprovincialis TaxID=29158 RepID=UPI003F7C6DF2
MEFVINTVIRSRKCWIILVFIQIGIFSKTGCDIQNFNSLYFRVPNMRMSSLPVITINNVHVEACAERCVRETAFECKSFDIDNKVQGCRLYNDSIGDPFIHLIPSTYVDHYRTAYEKLFHRLPNHIVTVSHDRKISGIDVEKCARRCVLEVSFKCQGFDYEVRLQNCWLTSKTPAASGGVVIQYGTDYYQRTFDGPFENFINFGYGTLRHLEVIHIYNKIMLGVNLEHCAQLCLVETGFTCSSFDYLFNDKSCHMSQYIAANVHGLQNDYSEESKSMHFEVKDEYLEKFYPAPYSAIVGHNEKTISRITPSKCARMCLMEREFICRSFDYQIQDVKCLLSSKTGSDVGGLTSHGHAQVHHFEMKPYLDCGGIFTTSTGTIASPNWPRNYPHNMKCTWNITVSKFKVIRLTIIHFNLGKYTEFPCDVVNDRLIITEEYQHQNDTLCVQHDVDTYTSKTNSISLTFQSNSKLDAPGFKFFYQEDWACGAVLTDDNGEFASPRWPYQYPSLSLCKWTIRAPYGSTIYLSFTSIELEEHIKGNCTSAYDRLEVFDGSTKNSSRLASLCGQKGIHAYTSSLNVLTVTFISDDRVQERGFHAVYKFFYPPTTTVESTTAEDTTTSSTEKMTTIQTTNATITTETAAKIFPFNASHLSLIAMFVEPRKNNSPVDKSQQSQMIDQTTESENIAVTQIDKDLTTKNVRLWHTIIIMIIIFIFIVTVVVVTSVIVCRYYRTRIPKRRNTSNLPFTEESETLYRHDNSLNDNLEKGSSESINLPQPSPSGPPPDVTFTNPMYVRNHGTSSSTLASSTYMEYTI